MKEKELPMPKTISGHISSILSDLNKSNPLSKDETKLFTRELYTILLAKQTGAVIRWTQGNSPWQLIVHRTVSDLKPSDILDDPPGQKQPFDLFAGTFSPSHPNDHIEGKPGPS
jgi:hypothetical protein